MRKKVVAALLILVLTSPVSAFVFSDPFAQMQRAIQIIEQKIQTLFMVKQLQQMINNAKSAAMLYKMAEEGFKKLSDPKQWDALVEYTKNRLANIIDWKGDPYNSPLWRAAMGLDQAFDDYLNSVAQYNVVLAHLDLVDEMVAQGLKDTENLILSPATTLSATISESASKRESANRQNRALWKEAQKNFIKDTNAKNRSLIAYREKIEAELEELNSQKKLQATAKSETTDALMSAQDEVNKAEDSAAGQKAMNKLQVMKINLEQILDGEKALDKKEAELTNEMNSLQGQIKENKEKVDAKTVWLTVRNFLQLGWMKTSLGSMANISNTVRDVQAIFFGLLVVVVALGLLWFAINSWKGKESFIPPDVIYGFIFATLLLSDFSPVSFHKLTKVVVVSTDAITMTMQKISGGWIQNIFDSVSATGEFIGEKSAETYLKNPDQTSGGGWLSSPMQKAERTIETASRFFSDLTIGALLTKIQMGLLGWACFFISITGAIMVFVTLFIRTLFFWVMMAIAPAAIFLLPLPYGRKIMAKWGGAVYAAILWGPITYILLAIMNEMLTTVMSASTIMRPVSESGLLIGGYEGMAAMFINAIGGLMMAILMLISPLISFKLANASYGDLGSVMGKAGALVGTVASAGAAATAGSGMALAGKGMTSAGHALTSLGQSIGGRGGLGGVIGGAIQTVGGAAGKYGPKVASAGNIIRSTGKDLTEHFIRRGLNLPKKKAPSPPPEKSAKVGGFSTV